MDNNQKDTAKEKIIIFVIGTLFGAVIATGAFLISAKVLLANNATNNASQSQQHSGTPPEMPNGENGQGGQGQPPEKPDGENNSQNGSN